jgi:hypothetical protein
MFALLLLLSVVSASNEVLGCKKLPLFSPLMLNGTSFSYKITGEVCSNVPGATASCGEATLVVDHVRGLVFNFSSIGGGVNTLTPTDSWFFGINGPGWDGACRKVVGYSDADQIVNYMAGLSTFGSTTCRATYVGIVNDVGGCTTGTALTDPNVGQGSETAISYTLEDGVIVEMTFANNFPFSDPNIGSFCFPAAGTAKFKLCSLVKNKDFSKYFVLPPECANPQNFCETLFYPGNVCYPNCKSRAPAPAPAPQPQPAK